eukprot:c26424_g1_i1 orf=403-798(-)
MPAFVKEEAVQLVECQSVVTLGLPLKSSLKLPRRIEVTDQGKGPVDNGKARLSIVGGETNDVPLSGNGEAGFSSVFGEASDVALNEPRSVQWIDEHGKELIEVREFEPSELGDSDDDNDEELWPACTCVIQ